MVRPRFDREVVREAPQQRRFPGVRVSDDGDDAGASRAALRPAFGPAVGHLAQRPFRVADAPFDVLDAPVALVVEANLDGGAPGQRLREPRPDTAGCNHLKRGCWNPGFSDPLPSNSWNTYSRNYSRQYEVAEPREFDLEFGGPRVGALREEPEDQTPAVQHLDAVGEQLSQREGLPRRQPRVRDDGVRVQP